MSIEETDKHIVALSEIVNAFCTSEDLAAFVPVIWPDIPAGDSEGHKAQKQEKKAAHEKRTEIARKVYGELESHEGEYREALDHLNQVIPVHVDPATGERNNSGQLSVLREALGLSARAHASATTELDQEAVLV